MNTASAWRIISATAGSLAAVVSGMTVWLPNSACRCRSRRSCSHHLRSPVSPENRRHSLCCTASGKHRRGLCRRPSWRSRRRSCGAVRLLRHANVLIGGRNSCAGEKEYGQEEEEQQHCGTADFWRHVFRKYGFREIVFLRKRARTIYRDSATAVYSSVTAISQWARSMNHWFSSSNGFRYRSSAFFSFSPTRAICRESCLRKPEPNWYE